MTLLGQQLQVALTDPRLSLRMRELERGVKPAGTINKISRGLSKLRISRPESEKLKNACAASRQLPRPAEGNALTKRMSVAALNIKGITKRTSKTGNGRKSNREESEPREIAIAALGNKNCAKSRKDAPRRCDSGSPASMSQLKPISMQPDRRLRALRRLK